MHGECTDNHVVTLRRRYGEKRLQEAALRRAHLNYQRISIGRGPGSGRVKFLLAQMHQTYYFGFSESACILAGTLLEQGLTYRLGAALDRQGPLPFSRGGEKRWLQTREDLLELELVDMLELAWKERVITEGRVLLLAHEIRWIRNMVVHEKIPLFRERDETTLEVKVARTTVVPPPATAAERSVTRGSHSVGKRSRTWSAGRARPAAAGCPRS